MIGTFWFYGPKKDLCLNAKGLWLNANGLCLNVKWLWLIFDLVLAPLGALRGFMMWFGWA